MKHVTLVTFMTFINIHFSLAQCDDYVVTGSQIFHGNDIRTRINTAGDMFWDLDEAFFQVPYTGPTTPDAIFAAALWFGGYDATGNLKVSAQTYRWPTLQEYLPGPLTDAVLHSQMIALHGIRSGPSPNRRFYFISKTTTQMVTLISNNLPCLVTLGRGIYTLVIRKDQLQFVEKIVVVE